MAIKIITANKDAYTSLAHPNTNYGSVSPLRIERSSLSGIDNRPFFDFPVKTDLPSGATIISAIFYYYVSTGMTVVPNLCYFGYSTDIWSENTITHNTMPSLSLIGTGGGVNNGWQTITIPLSLFTNFWYLDIGSPQITGVTLQLVNSDDDGKYAFILTRNDTGYEPYLLVNYTPGNIYKAWIM